MFYRIRLFFARLLLGKRGDHRILPCRPFGDLTISRPREITLKELDEMIRQSNNRDEHGKLKILIHR